MSIIKAIVRMAFIKQKISKYFDMIVLSFKMRYPMQAAAFSTPFRGDYIRGKKIVKKVVMWTRMHCMEWPYCF